MLGKHPQAAGDSWLGTGSNRSVELYEAGDPAGVSKRLGFNISVWYAESEPGGGHKPLMLPLYKVDIPNETCFLSCSFFFKQNNNLTWIQAVKKILRGAQFRRIFSRLKQMWQTISRYSGR